MHLVTARRLGLLLLLSTAYATGSMPHYRFLSGRDDGPGQRLLEERQKKTDRPYYAANTIDMPIDHFPDSRRYEPHARGTFKQYYYFDASYYQAGGPVILYLAGETDGRNRFPVMRSGIVQILANATGGLGVILENRYYGRSWPVAASTTDALAYLTNEQTVADVAFFARHAVFPGLNASLHAPNTPWILYGGSLAGAQTAFAVKTHGDVLYGGIAASAPIQAKLEYPEW